MFFMFPRQLASDEVSARIKKLGPTLTLIKLNDQIKL